MQQLLIIFRSLAMLVAYPIWALELEIETLSLATSGAELRQRLRVLPHKWLVRTVFLVSGGMHALLLDRACQQCEKTQKKTLRRILRRNRQTVFGKAHGFSQLNSYAAYRAQVPVLKYADLEPYIEREIAGEHGQLTAQRPFMYATTSGTTAKPKYIPITREAAKKSHALVQRIWFYYLARRSIGFLNDSLLAVTGKAVEGHLADGTPFGSTSGHMRESLPRFMKKLYAVPDEVFYIAEPEARYYAILRFAVAVPVSYVSTANPSTLALLFAKAVEHQEALIRDIEAGTLAGNLTIETDLRQKLERLLKPSPERAAELRQIVQVSGFLDPTYYWPRLAAIGCWKGGNAPVFIARLRHYVSDLVPIYDLGYLASELRGTLPIERLHHGGVPTLHRNFFEFRAVGSEAQDQASYQLLHELEPGQRYRVIVTTDSGLYRYDINDIVKVVSRRGDTPELVFEQKGEGVTNLTGEKLYELQVQMAMTSAFSQLGVAVAFYLAVADKRTDRYEFLIEYAAQEAAAKADHQSLLQAIEASLCTLNIEYQAKRQSQRLKAPLLKVLTGGAYQGYRQKRIAGGVREAQFKMVMLTSDETLAANFPVASIVEWAGKGAPPAGR